MRLRKSQRLHGLKRPRIRQSWNKYNLYNLYQNLNVPKLLPKTFFQQKWIAKALSRGYHGEHIKERKWELMFNRRLASVVEMDPRYMAQFDGSEQAAGRGAGLQRDPKKTAEALAAGQPVRGNDRPGQPWEGTNLKTGAPTPYMQMVFAPMERRLDIAIFRAMFASSSRQARQFVIHGAVKVNGHKMVHPGYMLNPGDMFQVDIERVLFATGAKKYADTQQERARKLRAEKRKEAAAAAEAEAGAPAEAEDGEAGEAAEEAEEAEESKGAAKKRKERPTVEEAAAHKGVDPQQLVSDKLGALVSRAKAVLAMKDLTAKRRKALRALLHGARYWTDQAARLAAASAKSAASSASTPNHSPPSTVTATVSTNSAASASTSSNRLSETEIMDRLVSLLASTAIQQEKRRALAELDQSEEDAAAATATAAAETAAARKPSPSSDSAAAADEVQKIEAEAAAITTKAVASANAAAGSKRLTDDEVRRFHELIARDLANPYDRSKPYATPWRPRPYMQAFAFIPRYLEVNQNVCAAIYLRHPVARPGLSEVPTPFPSEIGQLVYNWYLRRR